MFKVNLINYLVEKNTHRTCSISELHLCDFWQFLPDYSPCWTELFPFIYWAVVVLSFYGIYCCIWEYARIYCFPNCMIQLSRPRHYNIMTHAVLRKARLVGCIVMCYTWIMMIYGMLSVKPHYLYPWIIVNVLVLIVDCGIWITDVHTGRLAFNFKSLYPMCRLLSTITIVNFLRRTFVWHIQNNRLYALKFHI